MRKILLFFLLLSTVLLTACRDISTQGSDNLSASSDIVSIIQASSDTEVDSTISNAYKPTAPNGDESSSSDNASVCKHKYTVTNTLLTCVGKGYKTHTCTKCGNSYKESVAAIEHEYKNTEQAPTCTTDGYCMPVCQRCGYALQSQTIAATGHKFSGTVCTECDARDTDKAREMLAAWFNANSSNNTYYYLPSDNRYRIWANGANCAFSYHDDNMLINIQVYGFEKNNCYVTFKKDEKNLEGEFPMESLHSSDRSFFNVMNGDKDLIPTLRDMVDGFLLKFESELLKPQINISLKDIGFSNY